MTETSEPSPPKPPMLDDDIPCTECGYNLRGLQIGGKCPECGGLISGTLEDWYVLSKAERETLGVPLDEADTRWVSRLADSMLLMLIAVGLAIVAQVLVIGMGLERIGSPILVAARVLNLLALAKLSRHGAEEHHWRARIGLLWVMAGFVAVCLIGGRRTVIREWVQWMDSEWIMLIVVGAMVTSQILFYAELSNLTHRLSLRFLQTHRRLVLLGILVQFLVLMIPANSSPHPYWEWLVDLGGPLVGLSAMDILEQAQCFLLQPWWYYSVLACIDWITMLLAFALFFRLFLAFRRIARGSRSQPINSVPEGRFGKTASSCRP